MCHLLSLRKRAGGDDNILCKFLENLKNGFKIVAFEKESHPVRCVLLVPADSRGPCRVGHHDDWVNHGDLVPWQMQGLGGGLEGRPLELKGHPPAPIHRQIKPVNISFCKLPTN